MSTILSVFDSHCSNLVIDKDFCRRIRNFDIRFINKNSDHVSFFSGPLLGVYPARWTDDEFHNWVDDIIEVDEVGLEQDIHALKTVNPAFRVVSNVVNLSFIYVLYRLYNSKLPTVEIESTARSVIHIMHYKFITSIMAHYFRHPADKATAEATYNALTLKSDIRVTGSWGALVKLRGENFTARSSIHLKTFQGMKRDDKILFAVSDIQTRIRKVIKTQTKLFYQIKENEGKVISVSSMMQTEQGAMVKDVARESSIFNRYISAVVPDKRDFVRVELFNVIMEVNPSASPEVTLASLGYMADVYLDRDKKYMQELVEETIVYSLNFLREKRIRTGDLANIVVKVKSMLVGSRVNDDIVLKLRELGDRVINEASPRSKAIPTSPERTALLLYILLRALTKNYYSGSTISGAIATGKYKAATENWFTNLFSSKRPKFTKPTLYLPENIEDDMDKYEAIFSAPEFNIESFEITDPHVVALSMDGAKYLGKSISVSDIVKSTKDFASKLTSYSNNVTKFSKFADTERGKIDRSSTTQDEFNRTVESLKREYLKTVSGFPKSVTLVGGYVLSSDGENIVLKHEVPKDKVVMSPVKVSDLLELVKLYRSFSSSPMPLIDAENYYADSSTVIDEDDYENGELLDEYSHHEIVKDYLEHGVTEAGHKLMFGIGKLLFHVVNTVNTSGKVSSESDTIEAFDFTEAMEDFGELTLPYTPPSPEPDDEEEEVEVPEATNDDLIFEVFAA